MRIRRGPATVREGAASRATRPTQPGKAKRLAAIARTFRVRRPAQNIDGRLSAENRKCRLDLASHERLLTRIGPRRTSLSLTLAARARGGIAHGVWIHRLSVFHPCQIRTAAALALMLLALALESHWLKLRSPCRASFATRPAASSSTLWSKRLSESASLRGRPLAPTARTRLSFRLRTPIRPQNAAHGFADDVIELDGAAGSDLSTMWRCRLGRCPIRWSSLPLAAWRAGHRSRSRCRS